MIDPLWLVVPFLALLSILVLRATTQLRALQTAIVQHLEIPHQASGADHHGAEDPEPEWPAGVLDVNASAPAEIVAAAAGRWALLVLVRSDCGRCESILQSLPQTAAGLPDYAVLIVSVDGQRGAVSAGSLPVVSLAHADSTLLPTPAMMLVDDRGKLQGRGSMQSAADLLVFASEGQQHGFGPMLEETPEVDRETVSHQHHDHGMGTVH